MRSIYFRFENVYVILFKYFSSYFCSFLSEFISFIVDQQCDVKDYGSAIFNLMTLHNSDSSNEEARRQLRAKICDILPKVRDVVQCNEIIERCTELLESQTELWIYELRAKAYFYANQYSNCGRKCLSLNGLDQRTPKNTSKHTTKFLHRTDFPAMKKSWT